MLNEAPLDGERSDNMPTDVHVLVLLEVSGAGERPTRMGTIPNVMPLTGDGNIRGTWVLKGL